MRKYLFSIMIAFIAVIISFQDGYTQNSTFKRWESFKFSDSWSLNINVGATQFFGDLQESYLFYEKIQDDTKYAGGINFEKYLSPVLGVRGNLTLGKISGFRESRDAEFEGSFILYNLQGTLNISNLLWGYKPERKLTVYGFAGIGLQDFRNKVYKASNGIFVGGEGYGSSESDKESMTTETIVPLGMGFKYKLSERWDIVAEGTGYVANSDKLDYFQTGDFNDLFHYYSLGATYHFSLPEFGGGLKKMQRNYDQFAITAEPEVLSVYGDSVPVTITGKIPPKYFSKKAGVTLNPVLVYQGGTAELKPIMLQGEKVAGNGITISYDNGGTFTVNDYVKYDPAMNNSELKVSPVAYIAKDVIEAVKSPMDKTETQAVILKKKALELGTTKLADGVIYTSKRILHDEDIALADHGYERERIITKEATIWFAKDRHEMSWGLPLNKREFAMEAIHDMYQFLSLGYIIKNININAWASPEGEESLNAGLSERRAKTALNYVYSQFKKLYYDKESLTRIRKPTDSLDIAYKANGEDWAGFMKALDASTIADKNIIRNVVNSHSDLAMREQEIRNMTVIYKGIEDYILPPLRRADIVVYAYEPIKTDEEIAQLAVSSPEALSVEELLYAASLTRNLDAKLNIFKAGIEIYPKEWKPYNNAACVYLVKGNLDQAASNLEKANTLMPNNGQVLNNLGVLASKREKYNEAMKYYTKARNERVDVGYNMGIVQITKGDFAGALYSFGKRTCRYNIGLAQTITGNLASAASNLECAIERPDNYYLLAVIAARTGNNVMLFGNLKKAVQMNPAYKSQAQTDREFLKYFGNAEFLSIVK
ncbi:hypothetical protein ACFLRZ_00160 [Bacteroidota bacterium]